jgi:hypothetical protein
MAIGTVGPVSAEAPLATGHPSRPPSHRPGEGAGGGTAAGGSAPASDSTEAAVHAAATPFDRVIAAALARQDGLAHLFAAAAALGGRGGDELPRPLSDALAALAGLVLDDPPDGAALKAAFARAGLFHEALVLASDARASGDFKSVLATLRATLTLFMDEAPPHPSVEVVRDRVPPPRPGAPAPPEAAVPWPDDQDPVLLARRLVGETEHALARLALHQTAVIEEAGVRPGEIGRATAFSLALPIAGATGVSIATIRVERDDAREDRPPDAPAEPTWRVDVSLAVEPLGPIEGRIGLLPGRRVVAGLWCAEPAAVAPIVAGIAMVRTELEAAGIELGAFDVHIGRPPPKPRPAAAKPHRIDLAL